MIPAIHFTQFELFGRTFHVFGLLVVTAILTSYLFARWRARQAGIPASDINNVYLSCIIPGLFGAHWLYLYYDPSSLHREGWTALLKAWDGLDSIGGFVFGAAGGVTYVKFFRQAPTSGPRLRYPALAFTDLILESLAFCWIFARLGCALSHDHLGRLTDFPLAVRFAEGTRHDLGLYEFLFTLLILVPANLHFHRVRMGRSRLGRIEGGHVALIALLYGPARFGLDFLRATDIPFPDERWLGLTGAQYFSVALFAFGLALGRSVLARSRGRHEIGDRATQA